MNNPHSSTRLPVWRWLLALVVGLAVFMLAKVISAGISASLLGEELIGPALGLFAVLSLVFTYFGLVFTQKIVKGTLRDLGLSSENWQKEALIGAGIGLMYALIQFTLIIPNTGGALREDVIASLELTGGTFVGLLNSILVGLLVGGFCEELFFRGFLITNIRHLFGNTRWGLWIGVVISVVFFASGHAYQGWIGVVDVGVGALIFTGLYLWRGKLTAAIVAHGVWDMLALIGLYFLYG